MGKKKSKYAQEDEEVENTLEEKEEVVKPVKAKGTLLKPSEWARQDKDRPDQALFDWYDAQGVIPEAEYNELKTKVFRKK